MNAAMEQLAVFARQEQWLLSETIRLGGLIHARSERVRSKAWAQLLEVNLRHQHAKREFKRFLEALGT